MENLDPCCVLRQSLLPPCVPPPLSTTPLCVCLTYITLSHHMQAAAFVSLSSFCLFPSSFAHPFLSSILPFYPSLMFPSRDSGPPYRLETGPQYWARWPSVHNHAGWGQAATKHVVPTTARGHVEGEPNVIHSQMFTSDTRIGGPIFLCFGGNDLINTVSTCQRMW